MSNEIYVWDADFGSFFELNINNDYENLSKVTVVRTLNEQDKRIKHLESQLAEARKGMLSQKKMFQKWIKWHIEGSGAIGYTDLLEMLDKLKGQNDE